MTRQSTMAQAIAHALWVAFRGLIVLIVAYFVIRLSGSEVLCADDQSRLHCGADSGIGCRNPCRTITWRLGRCKGCGTVVRQYGAIRSRK